MDWLSFIAAIVEALAWPLALVTVILVLRKPLAGLIPLLQKLKYKDLELEFRERIAEVKAEADAVLPPSPIPQILPDADTARLEQLALISPRSAVLEAWRQVENATLKAAERHQLALPYKTTMSPVQVFRALERSQLIDREQRALMDDLRTLRNGAAHAPDFGLTSESAMDYARTAARLVQYLDRI